VEVIAVIARHPRRWSPLALGSRSRDMHRLDMGPGTMTGLAPRPYRL